MRTGSVVQDYLDQVCQKIKSDQAREEFRAELEDHIFQTVASLIEERGLAREDAETEAVVRMGAAHKLAHDMNKIHRGNRAVLPIAKAVFLTLTAVFGILNLYFWSFASPILFFSSEPMFILSSGPFDLRPFFWGFLSATVFLFVIPSIRKRIRQTPHTKRHRKPFQEKTL